MADWRCVAIARAAATESWTFCMDDFHSDRERYRKDRELKIGEDGHDHICCCSYEDLYFELIQLKTTQRMEEL